MTNTNIRQSETHVFFLQCISAVTSGGVQKRPNGCNEAGRETIVAETQQETAFASARLSDQEQLEEKIVVGIASGHDEKRSGSDLLFEFFL